MPEPLDFQLLFNIAATACSVLFGWILKTIWDEIKSLQQSDKSIVDELSAIKVLVAGKYVTRDELQAMFNKLDAKLDGIGVKLDRKVDR